MTIWEAAQAVLLDTQRAMNINEIYNEILKRNLYTFGAKNPKSMLSQAIRKKSSANSEMANPAFRVVAPSTYKLADSPN